MRVTVRTPSYGVMGVPKINNNIWMSQTSHFYGRSDARGEIDDTVDGDSFLPTEARPLALAAYKVMHKDGCFGRWQTRCY